MKSRFKIKAYALVYVLIITTIISLLCSFLLIRIAHAWQLDKKRTTRSSLIHNNENLKRLALSRHFDLEKSHEISQYLFDPHIESKMSIENWGLFPILKIESKSINDTIVEMGFLGVKNNPFHETALYLVDNNLPLSLSGDAQIIGNAYLPASGVRPGIVEGRSFKGKEYVQGNTFKSKAHLPEIDLSTLHSFLDKVKNNEFQIAEIAERSFEKDAVLIDLGRNAILEYDTISGKVIMYASESILIEKSAVLEDVIIIAPQIKISQGAQLSAQLLATESIHIAQNVFLTYPSLLYLNRENEDEGKIHIESGSKIEGVLIALQPDSKSRKGLVKMDLESEILGLAYVNGILEMQGNINGSLFCENLQYSGNGSLYLSYLVNSKINNNALPKFLTFPNLFVSNDNKCIIKWLD